MDKNKIVTINGQRYDSLTGMPIQNTRPPVPAKIPIPAMGIHKTAQKSQTLVRRATKKPVATPASRPNRLQGRSMDIARNGKITKFAPHPVKPVVKATPPADIPAVAHPAVAKAHAQHIKKQKNVALATPQSSKNIKEQAITEAMGKPAVKVSKKSFFKRNPKFVNMFTVGAVIVLLGAYLTYLNIPSWSVRVAAGQAGIDATYPEYRPDGYSIDGPVTYNDGQVMINFMANTGTSKFSLKQSKSSWDSSAVLDNIVRKKVGDKYITSQERGLTIYTYNGNAAWVNAGILYTIEGDAPLSSAQIRRIATSL